MADKDLGQLIDEHLDGRPVTWLVDRMPEGTSPLAVYRARRGTDASRTTRVAICDALGLRPGSLERDAIMTAPPAPRDP